MTERTWAPGDEGDLVEQLIEVEPSAVGDIVDPDASWESNLADALDQQVDVGYDDERDPQD